MLFSGVVVAAGAVEIACQSAPNDGAPEGATGEIDLGASSSSDDSGDSEDTETCAEAHASAALVPVNLLFVMDSSGSMQCNPPPIDPACDLPKKIDESALSKWESTVRVLLGDGNSGSAGPGVLPVLIGKQGLSAGLLTFPSDDRCAVLPDGELTTPINPLTDAQLARLTDALSLEPAGETPLAGAAIRGLEALRSGLVAGSLAGKSHLVLMTDGVETCQPQALDDLEEYLTIARDSFGINTSVIGAPGSESARSLLSELAFLGGTAKSDDCSHGAAALDHGDCHVDLTQSDDFLKDLSATFEAIVSSAKVRCDFAVPKDAFVDPDKVNVRFEDGQGHETVFLRDDRDCDSEANGWQYTSDKKEKIVLCGHACNDVRASSEGRVRVEFGCQQTLIR